MAAIELHEGVNLIIKHKLEAAYVHDKNRLFNDHTLTGVIYIRHMLKVLTLPRTIPLLIIKQGEYVAGKKDTYNKLQRGQVKLLGFCDLFKGEYTLVYTYQLTEEQRNEY